jgi:hypothetical protein
MIERAEFCVHKNKTLKAGEQYQAMARGPGGSHHPKMAAEPGFPPQQS